MKRFSLVFIRVMVLLMISLATHNISLSENTALIDSDQDGFVDILEIQLASDPYDANMVPTIEGGHAPLISGADYDNDGYTDSFENIIGSNPYIETSKPDIKSVKEMAKELNLK